ncbi:MAG: D-glycero-beta-D-manno-heptose-7-phosphate kinase, partial [Bacteroidota bacterium]
MSTCASRPPLVGFTEERLHELLGRFAGRRIAVVGDLMVDRYYWGAVRRISPEAPVPVVEVESESVRLGGAANVANNVQALGGQPLLIGLVGNDHPGAQLAGILREQGLSADGLVTDGARPTTVKTRVIAHGQHVVRIDNESRADCPDHLRHRIVDAVKYNIRALDAVIIEDYNKGVVTREIMDEIIAIAGKYGVPTAVDPKFNHFLDFRNVTVFKPNRREVEEVLGGRLDTQEEVEKAGHRLLELLGAANVLLTRGEEGMSLFEAGGGVTHIPTTAGLVKDVSGAGDTVISTLTMAVAAGARMQEAAVLANCAGGIVVGDVGIVPVETARLRA